MHQQHCRIMTLANLGFIAAGTVCTGLLAVRGTPRQMAVNIGFAMLIYIALTFGANFLGKTFHRFRPAYLVIALLGGIAIAPDFIKVFTKSLPDAANQLAYMLNYRLPITLLTAARVVLIFKLCAISTLFVFFYWLLQKFAPQLYHYHKSLDKVERTYLIISILALALLIIFAFSSTTIFYGAHTAERPLYYDVIYTSDTGIHMATNGFINFNAPENDIRQPLFALFALPIAAVATLIANALKLLPLPFTELFTELQVYAITINILQSVLLTNSMVLLSRLLAIKGRTKLLFLVLISLSYPFLLFALNLEQYILTVFWLILFIYAYFQHSKDKPLWYIGATGSLLTSGVIFPLLMLEPREKNSSINRTQQRQGWQLKTAFFKLFQCFVGFFTLTTLAGQLPLFFTAFEKIDLLLRFSGARQTLSTKLLHYFNFVSACFFAPQAGVNTTTYQHVSYQLEPISQLNWLGLCLLLFAFVGFFLNRRRPFARICLAWVLFSFVLLGIVGWGIKENGQILYSLYFSWAYFALAFMGVQKLAQLPPLQQLPLFRQLMFAAGILLIFVMAFINSRGLMEIINFGIAYYPVIR